MSLNSNSAYATAYLTSLPRCLRHLKLNMQKTEVVIPNSPAPKSLILLQSLLHHNTVHGRNRSSRTKLAILILPFSLPSVCMHMHAHMIHHVLSALPPWHMLYPSFHSTATTLFKTTLRALVVICICVSTLSHHTNSLLQTEIGDILL